MVAPSKFYQWPLNRIHCSQVVVHPGLTCWESFLSNLRTIPVTALRYFSPLVISPLLLKTKTLNRQILLDAICYYLQTVACSSIISTMVLTFVCLFRNYFGRFYKYSMIFLPCVFAGQVSWLFPKRTLQLFTTATSQATLETVLRHHRNSFTHFLLHSRALQTLLFMINSSIILHFKRAKQYAGFWFVKPHPSTTTAPSEEDTKHLSIETAKCRHQNQSCRNFILTGMKTYLYYGIPLDLLNALLKKKVASAAGGSMWRACWGRLKLIRFSMTGFFLSYVGIYRLSSCVLAKYCHISITDHFQHFIAAFLGGASYVFLDKITICSLSFVIAIQILWKNLCRKNKIGESKIALVVQALQLLPFEKIIFGANVGYLLHCFIYHNQSVNSLGKGLLNAVSHNRAQQIHDIITKTDFETLLHQANGSLHKAAF